MLSVRPRRRPSARISQTAHDHGTVCEILGDMRLALSHPQQLPWICRLAQAHCAAAAAKLARAAAALVRATMLLAASTLPPQPVSRLAVGAVQAA